MGLLDRTHPVEWSSLARGTHGGSLLTDRRRAHTHSGPGPGRPAPPPSTCTARPDTGTCTGVYPVVVALEHPGGAAVARFTTYLTYSIETSAHQLHFAWVLPVAAPVVFRPGANPPATALRPLPASTVGSLTGLAASLQADATCR